MLVKTKPNTAALEALKAQFPNDQVEFRNSQPTLWMEREIDASTFFTIASIATQHKMTFSCKRSGTSIRTILK